MEVTLPITLPKKEWHDIRIYALENDLCVSDSFIEKYNEYVNAEEITNHQWSEVDMITENLSLCMPFVEWMTLIELANLLSCKVERAISHAFIVRKDSNDLIRKLNNESMVEEDDLD